MISWKEKLISFVDTYKDQLTSLKVEQANLRALEKDLKGSTNEPSKYTITLNEIKDNLTTLYKQFEHQQDDIINIVVDKELKPKGISVKGQNGEITTITATSRSTIDYKKILDELIIDAKITHEDLEKYIERNTTTIKIVSVK